MPGIETIVDSSTKIYGGTGKIIVTGANGQTLSIFTPDGRLISTQKVTETDCHLTTIPGIYIVKVGQFATKVVVK